MQKIRLSKRPSFVQTKKGQLRFREKFFVLAAILFILAVLPGGRAWSQSIPGLYDVHLAWDPVPDSSVIGYRVHYGVISGLYPASVEVGNTTTATVSGLEGGVTYYFAVTAVGPGGLESDYSEEIRFLPGLHGLRIGLDAAGAPVLTVQGVVGRDYDIEATTDFKSWTTLGTVTVGEGGSVLFSDTVATRNPNRFYRTRSRL